MDTKQLWNSVLVDIELNVSKATFTTWFKDTSVEKIDDGAVHIAVPNAFVKEWLSTKYHNHILKALREINGSVRSLEYIVNRTRPIHNEPQQINQFNKQESALAFKMPETNKEDNLNPRYTFDSFVVGPFNELAFAASQAVIKRPGAVYNPFFIYGNTGHGKTHLIQAIGNSIKAADPNKKIFYVTSEKFAVDYVTSIQGNKTNSFKHKYRKYDVLIMDDIQFLSNKEKTQEELFHLFNTLYDENKQIIFSSDKHPNYIPHLEDRLKSRFGAGMIVDIPTPDRESRAAILKTKAKILNIPMQTEVIDFLAANLSLNIRELEGVLNSIACQTELKGKELKLPEVKNLIKDTARTKQTKTPQDVIKIIAEFYNIKEENIHEKSRKKEVIKPRQLAMYILREDFNISYPSIGEKIGGRDHTTVMHSCDKVKGDLKKNPSLIDELEQIRSLISSV